MKIFKTKVSITEIILIIFFLLFMFSVFFSRIHLSELLYENGFVEYKVVVKSDHDVVLYNINDVTDSIHLRLENAYNLSDEWMIEVHR